MIRDPYVQNLTASTTQTQAAGTVIRGDIVFATIANASDALTIGTGFVAGQRILVRNLGANAGLIFPPVGGAINGGSTDASAAIAASKATELVCKTNNGLTWYFSGISS